MPGLFPYTFTRTDWPMRDSVAGCLNAGPSFVLDDDVLAVIIVVIEVSDEQYRKATAERPRRFRDSGGSGMRSGHLAVRPLPLNPSGQAELHSS
jgi:hypothetical protein